MQKNLQAGSTASRLVGDWSGTIAQLNCNVILQDVADNPDIPTLADVNMAFSNSVSVDIITGHLKSVLNYAGIDITPAQLAETALSILSSYWYLNLAELCIFFSQLKNGSRGQFVWGSKINNQAIMVALADFCKDRRREIERKESEIIRQKAENGYLKIDTALTAIVAGIDKVRELKKRAESDYMAFRELFPMIPEKYNPHILWEAWRGNKKAIQQVYEENVPPPDIVQDDIGRYLCNYNITANK